MSVVYPGELIGTAKNAKGLLVTTATTANQVVLTYTPPLGTSFLIQSIFLEVYLTVVSTTELKLGVISVEWGGTQIFGPYTAINPTSAAPFGFSVPLGKGYPIIGDGSTALTVECTPATVTSTTWIAENIGLLRAR